MIFLFQNGTVVIENPDMLKASSKFSNGHAASSSPASAARMKLYTKGPTDKQIEARTSDGRRRITPIFIPPPAIENGAQVKEKCLVRENGHFCLPNPVVMYKIRSINFLSHTRKRV